MACASLTAGQTDTWCDTKGSDISPLLCSCQNVSHEPGRGHLVRQVQPRHRHRGEGSREGWRAERDGQMETCCPCWIELALTGICTFPVLFSRSKRKTV